jgi:hypothetical protein
MNVSASPEYLPVDALECAKLVGDGVQAQLDLFRKMGARIEG